MAWMTGVEVPEELAEQEPSIVQDEEKLEPDPFDEMRWPLSNPLGSVEVQWLDERGVAVTRRFEASEHRLFKIAAAGDRGRAVLRPTRGYYLVIAPRALVRDEAISGPAWIAPENVLPEEAGVVAHHVRADGETSRLLLSGDDDRRVRVDPATVQAYEFTGHLVGDAHRTAGPLFGREPPQLLVYEAAEPAQLVVGIEGPSIRRRPRHTATVFEDIRSWLEEHQPAWFFVRLYDENEDLLDSLDFRYARGLNAIEVAEHSPLPGPGGHQPVTVRFSLESGLKVSAGDGPKEITPTADGFIFPAHPDAQSATLWLQAEGDRKVELVVQVHRVWWAITSEGEEDAPTAWNDSPQELSADCFLPTSPKQLSVLFPEPGWAHTLVVGFRDSRPRREAVLRQDLRIDFPLRNLGEDPALRSGQSCALQVSVEAFQTHYGPITVGMVLAPHPEIAEYDRDRCLPVWTLGASKLMSAITRAVRSSPFADRCAVRLLRHTYYRPSRWCGPVEKEEFVLQALALVAALLERENPPLVPKRWRRRAELVAGSDPDAVTIWRLHIREAQTATTRRDPVTGEGRRE